MIPHGGMSGHMGMAKRNSIVRWALLVSGFSLSGALPFAETAALAQDQQSVGDWFRSLRVPGSLVSCCDQSDCSRTQARMGPAGYEAQTPDGRWISIPEQSIVRGQPNLVHEPVLCLSPSSAIYCFIPDTEG